MGSLYTSVMPHLISEEVVKAINNAKEKAKVMYICNATVNYKATKFNTDDLNSRIFPDPPGSYELIPGYHRGTSSSDPRRIDHIRYLIRHI